MKHLPVLLLGFLVVGLATALSIQQGALRRAELGRDSAEVARDSSRTYWVGQARIAARRLYQGEVQLAHALQQGQATGATLVAVRLERDSLMRVSAGRTVEDSTDSTATATGELQADSLGLRVQATVDVRPVRAIGPLRSTFTWEVQRAAIPLDVAVVCLPGHRAEARVSGPTWAAVTVQGGTSKDDICYPKPVWSPLSLRPPSLLWLGAAFAAGWVAH